jgi:phage-related protein
MSILQLYEADPRGVTAERVGPLPDATEALVRREINGEYSLSVLLPKGAQFANEATVGRAIKATVNENGKQQFFIIKRRPRYLSGGVQIYAEHQSYLYNGVCIGTNAPNVDGYCRTVWSGLRNYAVPSITDIATFTYSRDRELRKNFPGRETPVHLMDLLKGWLIEAAGGEIDFDGFNAEWTDQMGEDNGAVYRYGANLTEMEEEDVLDGYASGIYPYWGRRGDENRPLVEIEGKILLYPGSLPLLAIEPVDLSDQFDEPPTPAELLAAAQAYAAEHAPTGLPASIRADRARIAGDVPVDLGDTVRVVHERWGVDVRTRICSLTFDALRDRVQDVSFGTVNPGFAGAVRNVVRTG